MMTTEQYILGKLAEEAAEVAQIAIKSQQFGLDMVFPKYGETNLDLLIGEVNDTLGVLGMLNYDFERKAAWGNETQQAKRLKVQKWYHVAQGMGMVE
tara:strand:- start:586 stop:876 length:291 start_codon:yes stop_codon:yes gene_type:complete